MLSAHKPLKETAPSSVDIAILEYFMLLVASTAEDLKIKS
jgi:hypothetical protein